MFSGTTSTENAGENNACYPLQSGMHPATRVQNALLVIITLFFSISLFMVWNGGRLSVCSNGNPAFLFFSSDS